MRLDVRGEQLVAGQNALAKARRKALDLGLDRVAEVMRAARRHVAVCVARVFAGRCAAIVEQALLRHQHERLLGDLPAPRRRLRARQLVVRLREKRSNVDVETEPTRVITVRLPKSMHEYLRTEAHDLRTSMNKLCISKLLQVIGEDMIPNERAGGATEAPAPRLSQGTSPMAGVNRTLAAPAAVPAASYSGSFQPQATPPFKPMQARI